MKFDLVAPFSPAGGQGEAIKKLTDGYARYSRQTLLGITGSGKTFVMANLINNIQKPTLVLAHNKTLAAQLYTELKELFPKNRVEYFISYFDFYQPESYLPTTDTYIEKDSAVNEQIEKMRMHAVSSLLSRDDVIVVASISCIYGLGNPADLMELSLPLEIGAVASRAGLLSQLIAMQYERNDASLGQGIFRVRGDTIDIIPASEDRITRIELAGQTIGKLSEVDALTGSTITTLDKVRLFPARQFVVPEHKHSKAMNAIRAELATTLPNLPALEAQRLEKRVNFDLEMIEELGYCNGIENYSRHFDGRKAGQPPFVLLNYFPKDFLLIIDESHQTIPQARAMYNGDYARKKNLIDFGFRLPSAFDHRPLKFSEFEQYLCHVVFVSATPSEYELTSSGQVVELIIRPTGLLDPVIEIQPISGQIAHMIGQIRDVVERRERVLVTTLTKRMAEDLSDYLSKENIKVRYLHADIQSLERIELIRQLRAGEFDVLVGINLLREGLDLPEVSLICILDADKEGFLRDERSLIQTIGRAARNVNGRVILYADVITGSIQRAVAITKRRREEQISYNSAHGITPQTIIKRVEQKRSAIKGVKHLPRPELERTMIELDAAMRRHAEELDFEKAIEARDAIEEIRQALAEAP